MMKTLSQFINEQLFINDNHINEAMGDVTLKELTVKYNGPDALYLQVPEKMGESDVQIYLDDTMLSKFPAETHQRDFGKNANYITDAYFEYESMEAANGTSQQADIVWDDHYNPSMNGTNMLVLRVKGIKYCVTFEKFELNNIGEEEENIKETVYNLFNGVIADSKELPFELTLNKENIDWK